MNPDRVDRLILYGTILKECSDLGMVPSVATSWEAALDRIEREAGPLAPRVLEAFEQARLIVRLPNGYTLAHEVLLSEDESRQARELDDMFVIEPNDPSWPYTDWEGKRPAPEFRLVLARGNRAAPHTAVTNRSRLRRCRCAKHC